MTPPSIIGVTGAAGFIGSHLTHRLLDEGRTVIGVDDFSHGAPENLAGCFDNPRFTFRRLDCRDRRAMKEAFAPCESIVHLAAEKIPRYGGALKTLEANVAGAESIYQTAMAVGAHVVIASTSDVYGNATPPFAEDSPLTLGPPTTRRWAYAVSKLYDEHMALALREERGMAVTILRLFGSYGPRNHPSWWGGPQAAFIERLLDGELIDIHGDGRQVRTFTYVDDTVAGFVAALDRPEARGEVVNVGGDEPTTIARLALEVQRALDLAGPLRARFVPYEQIGGRYQDVRCRIPDTTKMASVLRVRATIGLEEGLRRTVAWHRERREVSTGKRAVAVA
jgi:nucleoside-diphosphate-sugar epimerase